MRKRMVLALLLLASFGAAAEDQGYAHGKDHCYYFASPSGWVMDNMALATSGVPMVFYPEGASWSSAPYAMYTRPVQRDGASPDSIRRAVDDVVAMYAVSSEKIEAKKLLNVHSKSGAEGQLWQFVGYSNGGSELAVYFEATSTVNFFVAQVPRSDQIEILKEALVELSESYRESTDCKPCRETGGCRVSK